MKALQNEYKGYYMKKNTFFFMLLIFCTLNSLTIKEIQNNRSYIWGKGIAENLQKADKQAIKDLISQISIKVEGSFSDVLTESDGDVSEYCKSVLNTYSNTTLHQAERKVIEKKGKVIVYRYIERKNLFSIFENRKQKINEYVDSAISAENDLRIADALKYYYWSLALLRSHPNHNEIKYTFCDNDSLLLLTELPKRINNIFSQLDFAITQIIENKDEKRKTTNLFITYNNIPVTNLDYHYWTGDTWTNIVSAKDGIGVIDFFGEACNSFKKIKLKCEYIYENKSKVDLELREVIENTDLPFFSNADFEIHLEKQTNPEIPMKFSNTNNDFENKVRQIITAINSKNYDSIKHLMTEEGYTMFEGIIEYGQAEMIQSHPNLHFFKINDKIVVRSIPMKFSFPRNDRTFIENVVFTFNEDMKVDEITFSLSEKAQNDILNKGNRFGTLEEKYLLIQFIESYKTAYCLQRIDYLKSIFDENALIIVGNVLKNDKPIEGIYKSLGNKIEYIKLSKKEYIQRLKRVFNSNEFVNIQFEENSVKKVGGNDKVYGIQIAQNYYSENYADKGYLFLMIDLNNIKEPKIYVRTWQPEKNEDGSIWGLSDFNY